MGLGREFRGAEGPFCDAEVFGVGDEGGEEGGEEGGGGEVPDAVA